MEFPTYLQKLRDEITSLPFSMWAYVALSIGVYAAYIAYRKYKRNEKDLTYRFAIALSVSWLFDGAVRTWYTFLNVARSFEIDISKYLNSFVPSILALGVVLGGMMHIRTLIESFENSKLIWRLWLCGLFLTPLILALSYVLYSLTH